MGERKKILYPGHRRFYFGRSRGFKYDMFLELLKEELARQHDILCWGWGYRYNWTEKTIHEAIDFFGKPDIILADSLYNVGGLSKIGAVRANIVGDFYVGMGNGHLKRHLRIFEHYDVLLCAYYSAVRLAREYFPEEKCVFWPHSVDINWFRNYERDRPVDVIFAGAVQESLYGPDRQRIQHMLIEMRVEEGIDAIPRLKRYYGAYVDALNMTKMAISNNTKWGFMPHKVLEIMACGAMLLTDRCEEFDLVGIKDGEHVVIYNDLDDLRDKIHYYLENDSERERIAYNGYYLTVKEFNMADAARKMVEVLGGI